MEVMWWYPYMFDHRVTTRHAYTVQSLQETFTKEHSHTGAQQDVSEFTHKLLEWIENAFKLSLTIEPSERYRVVPNRTFNPNALMMALIVCIKYQLH